VALDTLSQRTAANKPGALGTDMPKHFSKGLDHRMRDRDGEIRKKRDDTLVGTLRKEYGSDFATGYRADAKLRTVLKGEGAKTLDKLLKKR